jgi:Spy/CpxP family protein refolding chaperone
MRPLICTLAAALLILQAGCAADRHAHHGGLSTDELATELNLTAQQKTQVGQILDAERAEREQMRYSGGQMSREDRRAQMQAMQSELIEKLSTVLTPAQLQEFEQLEQQRWHHGHRFHGDEQGPPGQ